MPGQPARHVLIDSVVKGVRHKVIAFEEFLQRYPEFQGKVVLIQVALSTTEQNELQASITDVISHVNSRFGSLTYQPVVLLHTQDITFPMYLGLLTAADAFIVTSLREGMALRTHEFVECQHERKRPLLLSEVRVPRRVMEYRILTIFMPCRSLRDHTRTVASGRALLSTHGIIATQLRRSTRR